MGKISNFWSILMTPSDFENDPYQAATNQLSHIALGAVFSLAVCVLWFAYFKEMPLRSYTGISLLALYIMGIECVLQGWKGRDSIWDSSFVLWGITLALTPAEEVAVQGGYVILKLDAILLGWLLFAALFTLVVYLWPRVGADV